MPSLPPGEIAAGVDTQRVALIDDDAFRQTLADYLGKPVSLRLIAEIEAETANWFRAKGMPFVSIFAPEQEITGGVLQFRVTEFPSWGQSGTSAWASGAERCA